MSSFGTEVSLAKDIDHIEQICGLVGVIGGFFAAEIASYPAGVSTHSGHLSTTLSTGFRTRESGTQGRESVSGSADHDLHDSAVPDRRPSDRIVHVS